MHIKQDRSNGLSSTKEEPWQFISPEQRNKILSKEDDLESIVFLYGHTTKHIADAIEEHYHEVCPEGILIHISCKAFVEEVIAAQTSLKKLRKFRARYNSADIVIFEDIDLLEAHPASQREFLLIFEELVTAEKCLVITGKHQPSHYLEETKIEIFEDMISAIAYGIVVEVPADVKQDNNQKT